jgi:hypothetical protein
MKICKIVSFCVIMAALVFVGNANAQSTVTRYVTVTPSGTYTTEYVYVQPIPPPVQRITVGEVILSAALIYGGYQIGHNSSHYSHIPSHHTSHHTSYRSPRTMPIRSHRR